MTLQNNVTASLYDNVVLARGKRVHKIKGPAHAIAVEWFQLDDGINETDAELKTLRWLKKVKDLSFSYSPGELRYRVFGLMPKTVRHPDSLDMKISDGFYLRVNTVSNCSGFYLTTHSNQTIRHLLSFLRDTHPGWRTLHIKTGKNFQSVIDFSQFEGPVYEQL